MSTVTKFLWLLLLTASLSAQNKVAILDDSGTNPGMIIDELRPKPPQVTGSSYLNDEWLTGTVHLGKKGSVKNLPLKYDLVNKWLEIKTSDDIKLCRLDQLETFEWINGTDTVAFINGKVFQNETGQPFNGLLQRITPGKASLWVHHRLEITQPTYVTGIDMGNKDVKVSAKPVYYLVQQLKISEIHTKKEKNRPLFGKHSDAVLSYAKQVGLKFNRKADLVRLVDFYNSLLN